MGKKSRLKKLRQERPVREQPMMCGTPEGIHAVGFGAPPTASEIEAMTQEYQNQIRNSPLWDQMVKQLGEEKALELLKECRVKVDRPSC